MARAGSWRESFRNSTITRKFREGSLAGTLYEVLPGYEAVPNYLIADPAYPLTPFCTKEYHSCSNNQQVIFNNIPRSARNTVERAFGRLKARWGFLRKTIDIQIEMFPKLFTVALCCTISVNQITGVGLMKKKCKLKFFYIGMKIKQ